jgi:alanine-glyoxylate transaminase / serine-glyoxylate transaminase / serine-pyruvate transaminase
MVSSFSPPARVLMGPGPSQVPARILQAMARPTIGHLDPAFVALMDELKDLIRAAFLTRNAVTFPVSAPASAAMEMALVNILEPGDKVLVCRNGVFGGRMAEIATRCGAVVVAIDGPWGRAVDLEAVRKTLMQNRDAKVLAFVHAETSTGALSDAKALGTLAIEFGCLSLVDAVTSLAGVPLCVDEWQLDVVYSGTQKCLSCPPGLAPITFSDRAVAAIKARKRPVQSWFLDINLILNYWSGDGGRTYHHTAPINALYGLHEGLRMLLEEGLEARWQRHRAMHERLRGSLHRLGIEWLVPEHERLPQLNAVLVPYGVDEARVRRDLLQKQGLEIGSGLGPLSGKIWRIGLMGASCDAKHVDTCTQALAAALQDQRD